MAFLGMKGTGQFAADERPLSWREGILREYPNGVAPLTAILSKMDSEKADDYNFFWWTKTLPRETATATGVYTDVTLASAYTTAAKSVGDFLYVKMSGDDAARFRAGLEVHLVDLSDSSKEAFGKVTQVLINGGDSFIAVKLIQAIGSSGATGIDYVRIIGSINPQGGTRPQSQLNTPVKYTNYTQIFRDSLSLTRTAMQTRLRTVESRKEARREALEFHAIRMERAFIDSVASETVGDNGQPETTTRGLIQFIKAEAPENVNNFTTNADFSGDDWLAGGEQWLDSMMEQINRYGATEKLALVGSGALAGISSLAKAKGTLNLNVRQMDYGIQVVEWITPSGVLYLVSSPLFSQDTYRRNSMLIIEPKKLKFRYLQDTIFKSDVDYDNMDSTTTGLDGAEEEFLTEAGLEAHFPNHMGLLEGVGLNNALS